MLHLNKTKENADIFCNLIITRPEVYSLPLIKTI